MNLTPTPKLQVGNTAAEASDWVSETTLTARNAAGQPRTQKSPTHVVITAVNVLYTPFLVRNYPRRVRGRAFLNAEEASYWVSETTLTANNAAGQPRTQKTPLHVVITAVNVLYTPFPARKSPRRVRGQAFLKAAEASCWVSETTLTARNAAGP